MNCDYAGMDWYCILPKGHKGEHRSHSFKGEREPVIMYWNKGEPPEAMWCLATYLTNDIPQRKAVDYLWFNPDATHKWWIGNAGRASQGCCLKFEQPVTHWMPKPQVQTINFA